MSETNYTSRKLKAGLMFLTIFAIAMTSLPMAEAASCKADAGPVSVECHSDGPGGCAAAAAAGASGSTGAGCTAWDWN